MKNIFNTTTYNKSLIIMLLLLAICGAFLIIFLTPTGLNLSNDSVSYIKITENILKGRGIYLRNRENVLVKLPYFPPVVPLIYASVGALSKNLLIIIQRINALSFGILIFFTGLLVFKYTHSRLLSLLSSFMILFSLHLNRIHSWLWSEPIFYVFMILSFFFLAKHYDSDQNTSKSFYVSAIFSGLAFGSRYAGVILVLSNCLVVLILSKPKMLNKILNSIKYAILGLTLPIYWMIYTQYFQTMHTGKTVAIHNTYFSNIKIGLSTIAEWLLPGRIAYPFIGAIILGAISCLALNLFINFNRRTETTANISVITGCYAFLYLLFLLFIDLYTLVHFDPRIMSSLFITLLIFVFTLKSQNEKPLLESNKLCLYGLVLVFLISPIRIARLAMRNNTNNISGLNYYKNKIHIHNMLQKLPDDTKIYTNVPGIFQLFTSKIVSQIPNKNLTIYDHDNIRIKEEQKQFFEDFISKWVYLVYFKDNEFKETIYSEEYLKNTLNISLINSVDGVSIYQSNIMSNL